MRRCHSFAGLLLAAALLGLTLATFAADCSNGAGTFSFNVLGPELHDNLWQFASVRGWKATSSATTPSGSHNNGRMVFDGTHFGVADSACAFSGATTADGSTVVVVAEYTSGNNTTAQRAYYAAASFVATDPITISDRTMYEVPVVAATQDAGTVTVTWTEPTSQAEVVGYRILRSPDGLAPWSTVVDKTTGNTSATDTPGSGTFYYSLQIIYLNDTVNLVVSPHGLETSVTVP